MTTASRSSHRGAMSASSAGSPRRWSWAHLLALIGLPILVLEVWTVIAWAIDDPDQITTYRDTSDVSWYAAHVVEAMVLVLGVVMVVHLFRDCRRERQFFTFDMMFCLCGGTLVWADGALNTFQPMWLPSSNWVNVNSMCGHMPMVVNPDCGRLPDPILFTLASDTFAFLAVAMVLAGVIEKIRHRWPRLSRAQLVAIVFLGAIFLEALLEPTVIALHLWNWGGTPLSVPIGGADFQLPVIEVLAAGIFFAIPVSLRIFRDDRGLTLVERGRERHAPRAPRAVTMLAMYSVFQVSIWLVAYLPLWPLGFYAHEWSPKMPVHIVNGICDIPGSPSASTRYGPCPGSPGFRMPGRHSLPGKSP